MAWQEGARVKVGELDVFAYALNIIKTLSQKVVRIVLGLVVRKPELQ